LPEPALCPAPPRPELLRLLRARLCELWPALRVIAEDVLAAETSIDWVAIDSDGCAVAVLVGDANHDLEAIARALAHREWLQPRLGTWVQLGPQSGLRPEAGVRALVLCPAFRVEAVAAAAAAPPGALSLALYRCLRDGAGVHVLVEPLAADAAAAAGEPLRGAVAEPFRTRLNDLDLGLTAEEQAEFERLATPAGGRR
jgi:hypothetical protein